MSSLFICLTIVYFNIIKNRHSVGETYCVSLTLFLVERIFLNAFIKETFRTNHYIFMILGQNGEKGDKGNTGM